MNFVLAFYEPGQRHLDTEAWKRAEAGMRASHKELAELLALSTLPLPPTNGDTNEG